MVEASQSMSGTIDTTANRSSQKKKLNIYPLTFRMPLEKSLLAQQFRNISVRKRKKAMLFKIENAPSDDGGKDINRMSSPKRTNSVTNIMKSSYCWETRTRLIEQTITDLS
eukprot:CAMPEP_0197459342 /NCGR_PEP_ID=MMETSP1175-20131217/51167_1 /TAXON_ID=1003142 /ORGANISM="Triceratium dubium, Strain CCMP147" /LENGTH=110 /DNA_ID=CAMNT_0042994197 /DNA_START=162 /DNA_END=491 /DNA_ORIENTATION=+